MAEALATFAINEILNKVISLATKEMSHSWNFSPDVESLRDSIVFIQALLQDAGEKQTENRAVRIWLQRLQDLAYDAEDVLDEYGYKLLRHKIEIQSQLKKRIRNSFSSSNPILFRRTTAHKIENINESLEKIRRESTGLGLIPITYVESNMEETDSFLDTSETVGRREEVSAILNIIVESSGNISVLPIVGMPGLGKTTLAKMLSKKIRENKLFEEILWVCVSNTFDERAILRGMLESLDKSAGGINNVDALLKHLHEKLEHKTFFLVLDDVWNEEQHKWDSLMTRFQKINQNKRNCILVTTRSERVASIIETFPLKRHHPTKLSTNECWSIIKEKVFGKAFEEISQDLEEIGMDIANKCAGLPLLARILGGTMRLKKTSDVWSSIRDNPVWSLFMENKDILPILKISFDRMPSSSLKQCFSYCAIFPEDYDIEKEKLIQLWIAEGYIHPDQGRNMAVEDIGEQYFNSLLANSLFEVVKKDIFGNIESCKMHDVVHALAVLVSTSEIWTSNSVSRSDISNIRHVRLNSEGDILTKLDDRGCQKLRSLILVSKVFKSTIRNFKRMRVLDVNDSNINDLSTVVVILKHLRYLDISKNPIRVLPKSISKLYHLQTLRLLGCSSLEKPLRGIENLVKLKHIHFDDPNMTPSHIGKLTCLQTLPLFAVGMEKGHGIEELGSLKHLRGKLALWNLENVKAKSNAYEADMKGKTKLEDLAYVWNVTANNKQDQKIEEGVLDGLEPHKYLRRLEIWNFGGMKFPSWLSDHCLHGCLRRVELYECLNCIELPTLGEMPCLEYVVMKHVKTVRRIPSEFYTKVDRASVGSSENEGITFFPSLKELRIECMTMLREWLMPTGEAITIFPCLEELRIHGCPALTSLPVSGLLSLKHLHITYCSGLSVFENTLAAFANIETLYIDNCRKITDISVIQSKSLRRLEVKRCSRLASLPVSHLSSLEELIIENCWELNDLEGTNGSVVSVTGLASLVRLSIKRCGICLLPNGLQFSTSLQCFDLCSLPNLRVVPDYVGELSCIVEFNIQNCKALGNIPTQLQY